MEATLNIREDAGSTLRELFSRLLDQGICEALMLPVRLPGGGGIAPALVRDSDRLQDAAPLAPVMPLSEATAAGRLTLRSGPIWSSTAGKGRLGLVMHPCQIRAFVELVKLQQAEREHVLIIGIDCAGTYELNDYVDIAKGSPTPDLDLLPGLRKGDPQPHQGRTFREACRICEQPLPVQADLRIRFVGVEATSEIVVDGTEGVLSALGLVPTDTAGRMSEAEQRLLLARTRARDELFEAFRATVRDMPGLLEHFSTCIHCLNCMGMCPLCYCKECIFQTDTFRHSPADYARWMERKGAVRLPADTLLFHLTRLNHMVTSCVGCGLCDSACPNDLHVSRVFRAVGQRAQGLFDYVPGRNPEELIPIATFREDELE